MTFSRENRSPSGALGNNDASPARPMQGAFSSLRASLASDALALRVAPQAWHRSFARVASGRAAPVSCKSMRIHFLIRSHSVPYFLVRFAHSGHQGHSVFAHFVVHFPASIYSPPAASCLSATCRWPAALIFDLASASRQPSLRSDEADRLRPDN